MKGLMGVSGRMMWFLGGRRVWIIRPGGLLLLRVMVWGGSLGAMGKTADVCWVGGWVEEVNCWYCC